MPRTIIVNNSEVVTRCSHIEHIRHRFREVIGLHLMVGSVIACNSVFESSYSNFDQLFYCKMLLKPSCCIFVKIFGQMKEFHLSLRRL